MVQAYIPDVGFVLTIIFQVVWSCHISSAFNIYKYNQIYRLKQVDSWDKLGPVPMA